MISFVPNPLWFLPYAAFGLMIAALLFAFVSLSLHSHGKRVSAFLFLLPFAFTGILSIGCFWMHISLHRQQHDYNEIAAVARNGVEISVVQKQFGDAETRQNPDGTISYIYQETALYGYIEVVTDGQGVVIGMEYYD